MSAIECTTAGVKDMADGSLRITLEFEPRHATAAFSLFGARGTVCAIVALTPEAAKQSAQKETIDHIGEVTEMVEKPKGGQLARLAGMWCNDPNFWQFLMDATSFVVTGSEDARMAVCNYCSIESRAELDNNPEAAEKFHKLIREPYAEYLKSL